MEPEARSFTLPVDPVHARRYAPAAGDETSTTRTRPRTRGIPGVLVPANLLSCYLAEAAQAWRSRNAAGPAGRLVRLTFRPLRPVVVGTPVTAWARERSRTGNGLVDLELGIDAGSGTPVTGTAVVHTE